MYLPCTALDWGIGYFPSKPEGTGQDCEGNDWNEPAEKSDDETETHVIRLNLLHLSIFNNEDRSEGTNPYDDNGPTHDQPFEEIRQKNPLSSVMRARDS